MTVVDRTFNAVERAYLAAQPLGRLATAVAGPVDEPSVGGSATMRLPSGRNVTEARALSLDVVTILSDKRVDHPLMSSARREGVDMVTQTIDEPADDASVMTVIGILMRRYDCSAEEARDVLARWAEGVMLAQTQAARWLMDEAIDRACSRREDEQAHPWSRDRR